MKVQLRQQAFDAVHWFEHGDNPLTESRTPLQPNPVNQFNAPGIPGDTICGVCRKPMSAHGMVAKARTVCPGDWVVTDEKGKTRVFRSGEFEETFQPVEPT